MKILKPFIVTALIVVQSFSALVTVSAQTVTQSNINEAIRKEAMENSSIMNSLHYLSDLYGPRLTGSPNHVNAAKWVAREMISWGFDSAMLEPWEFGHPGWVNERAVGVMLKPVQDTLTFEVLAWTPSTKGVITADAFHMTLPEKPTQTELTEYFDSVRSELSGKIVFVGKAGVIPVSIESSPKRFADDVLMKRFGPQTPGAQAPQPLPTTAPTPQTAVLANSEINTQLNAFLIDNGVALRVNDGGREHGQVRAFANYTFDVSKVVPTVVMRNEDYGRITRLLAKKTPVRLEFDIRNRTVPSGVTSYNVIAEITGTDKRDEIVMLGGHLDSWHAATGATDNAIGCAVMMEAARILKALQVKPRRTIRVALWSGEEQGLLGSRAYVKQHFGTAEEPGPEYSKFNGYFNIDKGTGRARGMTIFGPPSVADSLEQALSPYANNGFMGVNNTLSRQRGGSDHTSFNEAGLPGIGVEQDPIEYFTHTWHTNLDTYERIIEDDVKTSAMIIAAAVYALAMSDEMLPRLSAGEMPPMPGTSPSPTATPVRRP